jgi:glycosyltransferase involved in cell wall biosynthesis
MTKPLVSVIIPTYNSGKYLSEALESVFSQIYAHMEVIVIDDGSTDETAKVLDAYAGRATCIRQERAGPSKARNTGIGAAKGEYTAFLDADDLWHRDKLKKQIAALEEDPEAALVYSKSVDFEDLTGRELHVYPEKMHSGNLFDTLLSGPLFGLPSVLVKTKILKDIGGFDENLTTAEDTHLYLRIARHHKIIGIPDILVKRRIHDNNLSHRVDVEIGTLDCLDRFVDLVPNTNPRIYPPMAKAYLNRGKAMMLDYFHSGEYIACNRTSRRLLKLKIYDPRIVGFFFVTLLPSPLIRSSRTIRQRLVKTLPLKTGG